MQNVVHRYIVLLLSYFVVLLLSKNFYCLQVFTFGSVPLKTYLPDGDIDLTAFSNDQNLKDTWANKVRDMLENEEKNENAEFHVKEVQYIQAEVCFVLLVCFSFLQFTVSPMLTVISICNYVNK